MISVIGAPVVISLLGCLPITRPNREITVGALLLKSRPKVEFSKIVRNHLGTIQEHPGGVLDDIGAVFWTPGSRPNLVSLVKRRIRQF